MSNTAKSGAALQGTATAKNTNNSANLKIADATPAPSKKEELKKEEPNAIAPPAMAEQPQPKPLSIQEKIEKLQNLNVLAEKREKLIETKKNLLTFKLAADGFSNSLDLRDGNGNSFKTSNSEVIKEVLTLLASTVEAKLQEVEKEIEF